MKLTNLKTVAAIVFVFFALISCNENKQKENDNAVVEVGAEIEEEELLNLESNDIMAQIKGDPDLGTFAQALNGRNVTEYFRGTTGPYTVFAPTNLAYSRMTRIDRDEYFSTENSAFVNYLVVQALLPPEILKEQINKNGGEYALTTMQGEAILATIKDGKIQLAGASGETAMVVGNKKAINGVIYVIDEVLFPVDASVNAAANN